MQTLRRIIITGTAVLALAACSSDEGPGKIGNADDIVVRNAGMPSPVPPPPPPGAIQQETPQPIERPAFPEGVNVEPPLMQNAEADPAPAPAPVPEGTSLPVPAVPPEASPASPPETQMNAVPSPSTPPSPTLPADLLDPSVPVAPPPAQPPLIPGQVPSSFPDDTSQAAPQVPERESAAALSTAPASAEVPALSDRALDDPELIKAVQKALRDKKVYEGPASGVIDSETLNALVRYQASNGLIPGGITQETLQHLGVLR